MSEEIVEETTDEVIQDQEVSEDMEDQEYEEGEESSEVEAETVEELEEELEEAAKQGASQKELESMVRTYELKVNGKNFTKQLDLSDEEAVKRELQKAYSGQIAMQQKAELEKALSQNVEQWKQDPWKLFEQLGLDADELAELRLSQRLEEMKKDPAELEREKMQKELEEARRMLKDREENEKRMEYERMQEEAAMELDNEISEALDAHSTLPATPRVVRQIADTMAWAITPSEEGGGGFNPDEIRVADVLPSVEKEIRREISELMNQLPDEMLEGYIGNKSLQKLKASKMAKIKKQPKSAKSLNKPAAPVKQKEETAAQRKGRIDDFMRRR